MSFLYPAFLWALTALSIPVIIHLFNFRKTKRIYFSSTRFLRNVQEATTAKRKLKHYLILASRILFLLFLVFAFAQPIIPASEQFSTNRNISIYLDNSLSMSVPVGEKTSALDAGIGYVKKIVEVFPPDTRYRLLTNDFAPFSNSYKTKAEVVDLLTQVRLSPISRSLNEVKERIQNLSRAQTSSEVFWISDFQQSTVGSLNSAVYDTTQRWHLIPLKFQSNTNIFIDTAYLENPFVVGGEKNTLRIKMRNDGEKAVEQLLVKLSLNGIQTGTASVNIAAKGLVETSFDLTTGLNGVSRATVSFNDYPVSFDNEFFLALNFSEKIRVLEIKDQNVITPVERVFGNKQVFAFRSFTVSNFNYSLLDEADLVVVNGVNRFDASLSSSFRKYVDEGGALFVIPGATPDVSSYKNLLRLATLNSVKATPLAELDYPDFKNPFFENVFEERSARLAMPQATKIMDWGTDRSAILKFKNEQAYLSALNQHGKIYLLATPLENEFTTLHNSALFVPIMYRMAASGKKSEVKPYYSLNEPFITLRLDSIVGEQPMKLVGEQEIVPAQRKLADQVVMELPRFTMNAGFYKVAHERDTVGLLAFNLNKYESLLGQYTGEAVKQQLGNPESISIFEANSEEAFSNEIKARYLGKPLWKYALILALFFLLAEILLIRFLK
jgi:Aerotolerance regulator N-terminal